MSNWNKRECGDYGPKRSTRGAVDPPQQKDYQASTSTITAATSGGNGAPKIVPTEGSVDMAMRYYVSTARGPRRLRIRAVGLVS